MSKTPSKLAQWLTWLDDHILLLLAGFLIAFIPLFPKLPLFDVLPGYIVRVRLEDFLVLGTGIVWLIQVLRKKVAWKTTATYFILAYAAVGLLSTLSAVFITQTVPLQPVHIGKTLLHYFRYLEYFSLFLFVFSAIKSLKDLKVLLVTFAFTVLAITVYGYGQKYFYWPVFSTMNREFSKGMVLYLTEHARVQSTFGGHYDLAAYLVITLPIFLAVAYETKNRWLKVLFHITHLGGLWLLIMSASRTSFIAYLVGAALVLLLMGLKKSTWGQKIGWTLSRGSLLGLSIGIIMIMFGADMYERFLHVMQGYPQVMAVYNDFNETRKETSEWFLKTTGLKKPEPPKNGMSLEELEKVLVKSDEQPTTMPDDVYVDIPDIVEVATTSADGSTTITKVEKERTWSENAMKYGLSVAIRLDTLWPRAIAGFQKNPVLGSGYATLTKDGVTQFTEAESTDNNFLRTLGETGLLGFITFYGLIIFMMKEAYLLTRRHETFLQALGIGFIAASVGLLINASYIDVFAASKVAFTYWTVAGLLVATLWLSKRQPSGNQKPVSELAQKLAASKTKPKAKK